MKQVSMAAIIVSLTSLIATPAAAGGDDGARLEGSWINEVKIVSCQQPHVVLASLVTMTTYLRNGTLIEGGGTAAPPPAVSRSAGHGIWKHSGRHRYELQFRSHSFDAAGRLVRITEVSSQPTLKLGDNPHSPEVIEPYHLSGWGTNRITHLDPATGAVLGVTPGCNYAESRPMLFAN